MTDYERITAAIRWFDAHRRECPAAAAVAAGVGLSFPEFEELCARWAGVMAEDFVKCLPPGTPGELRCGSPAVAQSGPRLVREEVTPAEVQSGGAGLVIRAGAAASPFGDCLIGETARGICHVSFLDGTDATERALEELRENWPQARLVWDPPRARQLADAMFHENSTLPSFGLLVRGTPFQVRVWRALLGVAQGSLVSYGTLAAASGCPQAARAVGNAVGANPIAYLIPCHRVIRESGACGHYRWGALRKRAMLAREAARRSAV